MQVVHTEAEWNEFWLNSLKKDYSIGLAPTMGALHQGHLDLISQAKKETDIVVVSIFVNPTQFNNPEDFEKYPVTLESDLDKLRDAKVDFVFIPNVETMYPSLPQISLDFGELEHVLEGAFRPGHFNGVGLIVSKLFHIIKPHKAFFGQKDLQQVAIIKRLTNELSFGVSIVTVPIRREPDGLAMSSRNVRLSEEDRTRSLILYSGLSKAKQELLEGKKWFEVQLQIQQDFENTTSIELEYFELVNPDSFEKISDFNPNQKSSICVAAYIGGVRLIDNLTIIP